MARKKLVYVKALIEITSDKLLPFRLMVCIAEGRDVFVDVNYSWKATMYATLLVTLPIPINM